MGDDQPVAIGQIEHVEFDPVEVLARRDLHGLRTVLHRPATTIRPVPPDKRTGRVERICQRKTKPRDGRMKQQRQPGREVHRLDRRILWGQAG